jgi:hypothetical protein
MLENRSTRRRDALAREPIVEQLEALQKQRRGGRWNRQPTMVGLHAPVALRQRACAPRRVERIDQKRRADHIGDRIPTAELMERHVLGGHAVDFAFHFGERGENRDRALLHTGTDIRGLKTRANLPKWNVTMFRGAEIAAAGLALAISRLLDQEAQASEHLVAMFDYAAHDPARQSRGCDRTEHAIAQIGESIEHSRDEHVAGYTPDGVEMDMHGIFLRRSTRMRPLRE